MAVRYNPRYPGINPLTYALANLGNAFLSGPSQFEVDKMGMETDKLKVERDRLQREFDATGRLGDVVAGTGYSPADAAEIRRQTILAGRTGADMGNIGRVYAFQTEAPQPVRDRAYMAAGGAAGNTETGFSQTLANRLQQAGISAGAAIQAARIAEAGRMARRWDAPVEVNPGVGVFRNPNDPRFPADFQTGGVPVPKVLPPVTVAPGSAVFPDPADIRMQGVAPGTVVAPKEFRAQNPSPLARLIAERDALPAGDPRRAAYDDAIAKESGNVEGATQRTRAAKIQELLRQGVSPERAQGLVDGQIKIVPDGAATGRFVEVDTRTGSVKPVAPNDPAVAAVTPPTPFDPVRAQRAIDLVAGAGPTLGRVLDASPLGIAAQATGGSFAPNTAAATSALDNLNIEIARTAMATRAFGEVKQITEKLPGPGFFRNPANEMQKLYNWHRDFSQALERDRARLGMPISGTERTRIQENIRNYENSLAKLDDFLTRFGGDTVDRPPTGTQPRTAPAPAAAPTPATPMPPPLSGRTQLPPGVTPQQAIQDARDAIKRTPAARKEIEDKLRSYGIDPGVLR